jgi:hypothetical protein
VAPCVTRIDRAVKACDRQLGWLADGALLYDEQVAPAMRNAEGSEAERRHHGASMAGTCPVQYICIRDVSVDRRSVFICISELPAAALPSAGLITAPDTSGVR